VIQVDSAGSRDRSITGGHIMKTYARHLTARIFGQTRMGGLYTYWNIAK
jgi:hypothetical protein